MKTGVREKSGLFNGYGAVLALPVVIVLVGVLAFASGNPALIALALGLLVCLLVGVKAPALASAISGGLVLLSAVIFFVTGFDRYGMVNGFAMSLVACGVPLLAIAWRDRALLLAGRRS
jgi:hypothetical protein